MVPGVCACKDPLFKMLEGVVHDVLILDRSKEGLDLEPKLKTGGSGGDEALICKSDEAADSSSGVRIGDRTADDATGPRLSVGGVCMVFIGSNRADDGGEGSWNPSFELCREDGDRRTGSI